MTKTTRITEHRGCPVSEYISRMPRAELEALAHGVASILYSDTSSETWDPDVEWDSDTPSNIADLLGYVGIYRAITTARGRKVLP